MKKFMKFCGITALVLIVLGMILGVMAGSARGRTTIEDTVRAITGGRVNLNLDFPNEWGLMSGEIPDIPDIADIPDLPDAPDTPDVSDFPDIPDSGFYDIDAADMFDRRYEVMQGDVEKYSLGSGAAKLEVEIGGCALYLAESGDSDFYLEAKNARKLQGYVEGDTLHVKALRNGDLWREGKSCEITLYVPANYTFREAEFEVGAGLIEINSIYADEVSLEAGAGSIEADFIQTRDLDINTGAGAVSVFDMQVDSLDGEVGMGYLYLKGLIDREADLECAMGSIEMYVKGAESDFNYSIECGMGSIEFPNASYSGIAREQQINNRAAKNMNLECAMGSIEVNFEQ